MLVLKRLLIFACAAVVAVLLGVGAIDLWTGQSFLHGRQGAVRLQQDDAQRRAVAAANTGSLAAAIDPAVGVTMAPGSTKVLVGVPATMDAFGMRRRVGPPPAEDACRVVVLGDSVAFGFGVADDQTIGHHLEQHLAAAVGADRPRPVVFTVACPGWNQRNAFHFIRGALARLRPKVVVFLPAGNDLHDGYGVTEGGHRSLSFDPQAGGGRVHTSYEQWHVLVAAQWQNASTAMALRVRAAGGALAAVPPVLITGLTPESDRRWKGAVDEVVDLRRRLSANACSLVIAFSVYLHYESLYHLRVRESAPDLPMIWTFPEQRPEDRLPTDPHPNPGYTHAMAWCIAAGLIADGLIPGAEPARLPPLPAPFDGLRMVPPDLDRARALVQEMTARWRGFLDTVIEPATARGFHQVYGAVHRDATVERALWVALRRPDGGARALEAVIERLPVESGIYPLSLAVHVDGRLADRIEVPAPAPGAAAGARRFTFRIDVEDRGSLPCLDVEVRPDNVVRGQIDGISRGESFRLVRIGLLR